MPFDASFLGFLRSSPSTDWAAELQAAVAQQPEELVGALLLREGLPLALVWAPLSGLHTCESSLGNLLIWPVLYGADQMLAFHTQVTTSSGPGIEAADRRFARRLRDLGQLFGAGITLIDHLLFRAGRPPISLRAGMEEEEPATLREMSVWQRQVRRSTPPRYRQPATGQTWSGRGTMPDWLVSALERGFDLRAFEWNPQPSPDRPLGIPADMGLFGFVGPSFAAGAFAPRDELQEIRYSGFEVRAEPKELGRILAGRVLPHEPLTGLFTIARDQTVTGPRAGVFGPETTVKAAPATLFRPAVLDGGIQAVTFTALPKRADAVFSRERRELVQQLAYLGEVLCLPVVDHLIVQPDSPPLSLRESTRWSWPRMPPVDDPLWPPVRRAQQRVRVIQHPTDGRTWDRRGNRPGWLDELLAEGFTEEELLVYVG